MEYIHDAFISYRHLPADHAVAEKLQSLLESMKKDDGKFLKVFRDKSDLPTSSDLGSGIRRGLENSRYLIVICSPGYQESKWCMEELTYFRKIHGGNGSIIPILVEGEPDESFPEVLRYEERTILDQNGNPVLARIEMEPLAADVRGETNAERLKNLRTEYLRVAAPILGVTFDQLYQRAERKKRRIYAMVIAAMTAFLVYSIFMIAQINRRQKMLEEKQQELYQNESIRLANESLLLVEEDPALAMVLANVALPEDLSRPDYPMTAEAELAIRSMAVQHQYDEATEDLTLLHTIRFESQEGILYDIYDNGRYFSILDNGKTKLYEAYTGKLISELPGSGYEFYDGVNRYFRWYEDIAKDSQDHEDKFLCRIEIWDTRTGEKLGQLERTESEYYGSYNYYVLCDEESRRLWVAEYEWDRDTDVGAYIPHGWFDLEGVFHEESVLPAHLQHDELWYEFQSSLSDQESGSVSIYWNYFKKVNGDYDYDHMVDVIAALEAEINAAEGTDAYRINSCYSALDGAVYMIEFAEIPDADYGMGIWSAEEERLVFLMETEYYKDDCLLEVDTGLLYVMSETELRVYELKPENFDLPQAPLPFWHVSEDGVYGYGEYDRQGAYSGNILLYDTSKLKDVRCDEYEFWSDYGVRYEADLMDTGEYLLDAYVYAVTPDCRKVVAQGMHAVILIDIPSGERISMKGMLCTDDLVINNDGSMIAHTSDSAGRKIIHIYDTNARKYVGRLRTEIDPDLSVYLEISENMLLAATDDTVYVYDLMDLKREPMVTEVEIINVDYYHSLTIHGEPPKGEHAFAGNGLLILPSRYMDALVSDMPAIAGIVDLKTGEPVGFDSAGLGPWSDYAYDPVGGNLIQQAENHFVVQRRGESGDFEVIYTISPSHLNMMLHSAGHACDGQWLVLQNEEVCEIYRLEDGMLCYTIRKPDHRISQMAVIDGKLYDFSVGWDRVCIPLPDINEARMYVRSVLTYEHGRRTLTNQEMAEYYIPSHWQEK